MHTTTDELSEMRADLVDLADRVAHLIATIDAAIAAPSSPFDSDGTVSEPTPALAAVPPW